MIVKTSSFSNGTAKRKFRTIRLLERNLHFHRVLCTEKDGERRRNFAEICWKTTREIEKTRIEISSNESRLITHLIMIVVLLCLRGPVDLSYIGKIQNASEKIRTHPGIFVRVRNSLIQKCIEMKGRHAYRKFPIIRKRRKNHEVNQCRSEEIRFFNRNEKSFPALKLPSFQTKCLHCILSIILRLKENLKR